jgi:hypothetical protein
VSPELFGFLVGVLTAAAVPLTFWFLRRMRAEQVRDEEWATGPLPILPPPANPYPSDAPHPDMLAHGRHRR